MPDWLPAAACEEWRRVVPQLLAQKLLTRLDKAALAGYCVAVARVQECQERVAKEGSFYRQNGSKTRNPALVELRNWMTVLRQYSELFGLSPTARTRLKIAAVPELTDEQKQKQKYFRSS
jgi:P27 family predicted phage terminase small subunit